MNLNQWIKNRSLLEKDYGHYLKRKLILKIPVSKNLVKAHIEKAEHNLDLSYFLLQNNKFEDWVIVGLYYSLYHTSLVLLADKGYASKDHNATICFVIKHHSFLPEEIKIYNELAISNEEAMFYTTMKEERRKASYSTKIIYNKEHIMELRAKTIKLVNKIKTILGNSPLNTPNKAL